MLATHSVGSYSLRISSRLSRGLSSSFNSTLTATGTSKGGITTGDTSSSTSKCSLTASHLAHGRILNTSASSDRTIPYVRPFDIVHFCALRLAQNPLRATCQSVRCPDAELPPGSFYARFSPEEWCRYINYHNTFFSILNVVSWVSHSCYDGAQHSQFGLGVGNKFSHSFLDFSISRQVAAGRDIAGYSSVHLHFKSFVPDFHGCINSALVAADSIDLFSE